MRTVLIENWYTNGAYSSGQSGSGYVISVITLGSRAGCVDTSFALRARQVARDNACGTAWHGWDYSKPVWLVCGVVPIAARNIAGIVVWSIHAGSMEGPLMYLQPMPWVRGMYYRCGVLETHDDYATR